MNRKNPPTTTPSFCLRDIFIRPADSPNKPASISTSSLAGARDTKSLTVIVGCSFKAPVKNCLNGLLQLPLVKKRKMHFWTVKVGRGCGKSQSPATENLTDRRK